MDAVNTKCSLTPAFQAIIQQHSGIFESSIWTESRHHFPRRKDNCITQPAINLSKLTIETLEQDAEYVQS